MVSLRKTLAIVVLLLAGLLAFGAWSVCYDLPRVHAAIRDRGEEAGRDGVPVEACPYGDYEKRHWWLSGWIDGYRQRNKPGVFGGR